MRQQKPPKPLSKVLMRRLQAAGGWKNTSLALSPGNARAILSALEHARQEAREQALEGAAARVEPAWGPAAAEAIRKMKKGGGS